MFTIGFGQEAKIIEQNTSESEKILIAFFIFTLFCKTLCSNIHYKIIFSVLQRVKNSPLLPGFFVLNYLFFSQRSQKFDLEKDLKQLYINIDKNFIYNKIYFRRPFKGEKIWLNLTN